MSDHAAPADAVRFEVVLQPHRSLGPKGFHFLMLLLSAIAIAAGIVFLGLGAWPVLGFLGLNLLALYGAFGLSYRSGRLYERLKLSEQALAVNRVHPDGRVETWSLAPNWLRVEVQDDGPGRGAIRLASHGRAIAVGRFLSAEDRYTLAAALEAALGRWRLAPHLKLSRR